MARITQDTRIDDVAIISMLMLPAARASNIRAATPGLLFIPAPTSDTLAISSSTVNPEPPTSCTTFSMTVRAWGTSALGSVNDRSVVPSRDTFWTIMSTLIASSAMARKMLAATPGRSGTSASVIFASDSSWATPEMIACSIRSSSSVIHVPDSSENEERTWTFTP